MIQKVGWVFIQLPEAKQIIIMNCCWNVNRTWDQTNLVLSLIEQVKDGFLLSLMCMFAESNGTKFWSQRFQLQNSGILQTRMNQSKRAMKMNFDNFQIQKWILRTVRWKNGIISLVSFFPSDLWSLNCPK